MSRSRRAPGSGCGIDWFPALPANAAASCCRSLTGRRRILSRSAPPTPRSSGCTGTCFGPSLACSATCPACGEALQLDADVAALLAGERAPPAEPPRVRVDGWEVAFRAPPRRRGRGECGGGSGHGAAPAAPALRVGCSRGDERASIAEAPLEVTTRVDAELEQIDPLAVLDFELECARCGHCWSAPLDVSAFLWARLDVWVRRLLSEINTLASAYGWSEATIATMSPWKRQAYLDLVAG